jgi:hypothetical protein
MGVPRRFAIPNDCLSCTLRQTCDFCNLPQPLMTAFNAMGHLTLYPANATLLVEAKSRAASISRVPVAPSSRWGPALARQSS